MVLPDVLPDPHPQPAGPRRRGRPRNEGLRRTILRAAADLLEERGVEGVTIEAIAGRAGVGKQTIYRRWSTRAAVLVEAFLSQDESPLQVPDAGSLRKDLAAMAAAASESASSDALRRSVAGLVAASHVDPEVGRLFRERFIAPVRAVAREVLQRALERGELHPDVDIEVVIDQLLGAIWYRALLSGGRLGPTYAEALAADLVHGIALRDGRPPEARPARPRTGREETMDLFGSG